VQSVHDFVTSFFSKEAAAPQEPAADTSKVDTQDDIGYVAVTQEPTTDPTGDTQEPPVVDANDKMEPNNNSFLHWNLQLQKPRLP